LGRKNVPERASPHRKREGLRLVHFCLKIRQVWR
jgi:hypothetical protein